VLKVIEVTCQVSSSPLQSQAWK